MRRPSDTARREIVAGMTNSDAAADVIPGPEQVTEAQQELLSPALS